MPILRVIDPFHHPRLSYGKWRAEQIPPRRNYLPQCYTWLRPGHGTHSLSYFVAMVPSMPTFKQHRQTTHLSDCLLAIQFLADRTWYTVAYATVLRTCLSSVTYVLWLNGASYSNRREIDWYQNEWPWPLFRGRLRSCQPLRHIRHWISRKQLE